MNLIKIIVKNHLNSPVNIPDTLNPLTKVIYLNKQDNLSLFTERKKRNSKKRILEKQRLLIGQKRRNT